MLLCCMIYMRTHEFVSLVVYNVILCLALFLFLLIFSTVFLFLLLCSAFVMQDLEPSHLLAYDVADHTDAPMDTGGEKPDLGDRYGGVLVVVMLLLMFLVVVVVMLLDVWL